MVSTGMLSPSCTEQRLLVWQALEWQLSCALDAGWCLCAVWGQALLWAQGCVWWMCE